MKQRTYRMHYQAQYKTIDEQFNSLLKDYKYDLSQAKSKENKEALKRVYNEAFTIMLNSFTGFMRKGYTDKIEKVEREY